MISPDLPEAAGALLAASGYSGDFDLQPCVGGANNKVFRVDVGGARLILKAYFQHQDDTRDRLGAEFSFLSFAWENKLRCVPRPLACDRARSLALYEFVEGRQLLPSEVSECDVTQAYNFYRDINTHRSLPGALSLPNASEACFAISEHLRCLRTRLECLTRLDGSLSIDREARSFVRRELWDAWQKVLEAMRRGAWALGCNLEDEIDRGDWRLSPSDFGFHNAILAPDGFLRFIDFEYAGWDDPAKMICDFFCQPAVPVPTQHFGPFVESVVSDLSMPEAHSRRVALLLPVYRLKWCCIMLNDFLPAGKDRRRFAGRPNDHEERKLLQLQKARRYFQEAFS